MLVHCETHFFLRLRILCWRRGNDPKRPGTDSDRTSKKMERRRRSESLIHSTGKSQQRWLCFRHVCRMKSFM